MKNIYGKRLQSCQLYSNDNNGFWDPEGYCSELGGGVHQICFKVDKSTKIFQKILINQIGQTKELIIIIVCV